MSPRNKHDQPYSQSVQQLFSLGVPGGKEGPWRLVPFADYGAMGLSRADAAELERLATDTRWDDAESPMTFGPVHACRALGALGCEESIPALVAIVRRLDRVGQDMWLEDLPRVFGRLGRACIRPLAMVLRDERESFGARLFWCEGLERIAVEHPDARAEVVKLFMDMLGHARFTDPGINGSVMGSLIELRAVEALPRIREVYNAGLVDEIISGGLEQVESDIAETLEDRAERMRQLSARVSARMDEPGDLS